MAIRFNDIPFNLIGRSGKWDSKTNKYINKYEGILINDRLWVIGEPHLNEERQKKDGTKYRLYQHDAFVGNFIIGLINDDYIIGTVNSSWLGEFFEFQNDEEPKKVDELEKKWIDDGCLVAIKVKGENLTKLAKDFNDYLFTDDLIILSDDDNKTYPLVDVAYESFKTDYTRLDKPSIRCLKQQGLYLEIIESVDEVKDVFDGFTTKQDFIDITELVDEFNKHIGKIVKDDENNNKGSYRSNAYTPEKKLSFIKEQLKASGFEGESIKDIIEYGKQSKTQWFVFITTLGISGSYIPKFEYPFDVNELDISIDNVESTIDIKHEPVNNNSNGKQNIEDNEGVKVLNELMAIPGQIPKEFDINLALTEGSIDEEWLSMIHQLSGIIDLTERIVKSKMKRINKQASSIIHLDKDELIELKNQLI